MTWIPDRYVASRDSRCLWRMSTTSSTQRFWKVRPHSADAPAAFGGAESHCCVHCLKMSCCICSDDSEALRKLSKSMSNIVLPLREWFRSTTFATACSRVEIRKRQAHSETGTRACDEIGV